MIPHTTTHGREPETPPTAPDDTTTIFGVAVGMCNGCQTPTAEPIRGIDGELYCADCLDAYDKEVPR